MDQSSRKIDAIFELREAAEAKARAEKEVDDAPSAEKRDRLLETQLTLEEKTVAAITACHECGHEHAPDQDHRWNGGG
jgi:hypothetical protein